MLAVQIVSDKANTAAGQLLRAGVLAEALGSCALMRLLQPVARVSPPDPDPASSPAFRPAELGRNLRGCVWSSWRLDVLCGGACRLLAVLKPFRLRAPGAAVSRAAERFWPAAPEQNALDSPHPPGLPLLLSAQLLLPAALGLCSCSRAGRTDRKPAPSDPKHRFRGSKHPPPDRQGAHRACPCLL